MLKLSNRIAKLEKRPALRPPVQPCPGCGDHPNAMPTYRFEFAGECKPEWCGSCGRQLVFAMEFDRAG